MIEFYSVIGVMPMIDSLQKCYTLIQLLKYDREFSVENSFLQEIAKFYSPDFIVTWRHLMSNLEINL